MDDRDFRITGYRTGNVHWRGHYTAVHLPTGLSAEWEEKWNNRSERKKALADLAKRVESVAPPTGRAAG